MTGKLFKNKRLHEPAVEKVTSLSCDQRDSALGTAYVWGQKRELNLVV